MITITNYSDILKQIIRLNNNYSTSFNVEIIFNLKTMYRIVINK